jgi:hypothetical protein
MKLIGLLTATLMICFGVATSIAMSSTSSDTLISCRKTNPEAPPETEK